MNHRGGKAVAVDHHREAGALVAEPAPVAADGHGVDATLAAVLSSQGPSEVGSER